MDWLMGKGKRKEKDCTLPSSSPSLSPDEPRQYLEQSNVQEGIHYARVQDLEALISLPPGVQAEEWYAWHTISFFQNASMLYGIISDSCTPGSCPSMTAPNNTTYHWMDEKGKKLKCTASQYIDYAMSFCQKTANDPLVFPTKCGVTFPSTFITTVRRMNKLLFHIIAHVYYAHFARAVTLDVHGHLNTFFAHFIMFNRNFNLIDEKETDIMQDLINALRGAHQSLAAAKATESENDASGLSPSLAFPRSALALNGEDKENHNTTLVSK